MNTPDMRTVAVVPAFNCETTIAQTVAALLSDNRVGEVIVVDDGSGDQTRARAAGAGATVIRLEANRGKHEALRRGMQQAAAAPILLMVDADTGASAAGSLKLIDLVAGGQADMAVGILPPAGNKGGLGMVRATAARLIKVTSGFESKAPMSGQRALRREIFLECGLRGYRYGVDTLLTADAVCAGFRVIETPVEMTHEHRGRGAGGFSHRARQGLHLAISFRPFKRPVRKGKVS